jgi:hypothetical protein
MRSGQHLLGFLEGCAVRSCFRARGTFKWVKDVLALHKCVSGQVAFPSYVCCSFTGVKRMQGLGCLVWRVLRLRCGRSALQSRIGGTAAETACHARVSIQRS